MVPSILISLQSSDELQLVQDLPFFWLDLKNPATGSLGCPSETTAQAFIDRIAHLSAKGKATFARTTSVALGELNDALSPPLQRLANRFDYAKVGLARCNDSTHPASETRWLTKLQTWANELGMPSRLIPVYYADYHLASSPKWHQILAAARLLTSQFVLVDTFDKSKGRLWDWLTDSQLRSMAHEANESGIQISLAGSIRSSEIERTFAVGASLVGLRTAACQSDSRTNMLCEKRLNELARFALQPIRN